jgi:transposase
VQVGLPRSDFGKAVRYMLERWEGLTHFVDNPRVPLDNNAIERPLRGPVVSRKNHYGSRSFRGTQVAALFYTLCETAKLLNVDPHSYLLRTLHAAIAQPGAVTFPDGLFASTASV